MTTLEQISDDVQMGRLAKVKEAVAQALGGGILPRAIMDDGLLNGMRTVAKRFDANEVFVPHVLAASRAVNAGLQILKPHLPCGGPAAGVVVMGTVEGDLHDIGKNIVRIMMECRGLRVIDLGVSVSPEEFYRAAVENKADIVCCSTLLTATMREMRRVVDYFNERDGRRRVKIMVGGAPVTQRYCTAIGADIYTRDAVEASRVAYDVCLAGVS